MNPYNYQNECQWTRVRKEATTTRCGAVTQTGAWQMTIQGNKQMTPRFTRKSGAVRKWSMGHGKQHGHAYNKHAHLLRLNTTQKGGQSVHKERTHHGTQTGGASKQDGAALGIGNESRAQPVLATSHAMPPVFDAIGDE